MDFYIQTLFKFLFWGLGVDCGAHNKYFKRVQRFMVYSENILVEVMALASERLTSQKCDDFISLAHRMISASVWQWGESGKGVYCVHKEKSSPVLCPSLLWDKIMIIHTSGICLGIIEIMFLKAEYYSFPVERNEVRVNAQCFWMLPLEFGQLTLVPFSL